MKLMVEETETIERKMTIEESLLVETRYMLSIIPCYPNDEINELIQNMGFIEYIKKNVNSIHGNIGKFSKTVEREATPQEYMAWHFSQMQEQCDTLRFDIEGYCANSCPIHDEGGCMYDMWRIKCLEEIEGKTIRVVL